MEQQSSRKEEVASREDLVPSSPPVKTVSLEAENLDPAEVLLAGDQNLHVQIPVPSARVFNNLAEYFSRTFSKKREEEKLPPSATDLEQQQISVTKRPLPPGPAGESRPHRGLRRDSRSVLDKMAESGRGGPLSLLYRAMNSSSEKSSSSSRVRILVRRRKALPLRSERFSWITGYLAAFDKHLNLALREAVEEYDHQLLDEEAAVVVVRVRKLTQQLFVRGDTVVLVSLKDSQEEVVPSL